MKKTKLIATLGVAMALYVSLSVMLHIPLFSNVWLDFGYTVYGFTLALLGPVAAIVGVGGVFLENVLFAGWISYSWMAGQLFVGIVCGLVLKKYREKTVLCLLTCAVCCWVGIGFIKTVIEIALGYGIFPVKIVKNSLASVADFLPMALGYFLARLPFARKLERGESRKE